MDGIAPISWFEAGKIFGTVKERFYVFYSFRTLQLVKCFRATACPSGAGRIVFRVLDIESDVLFSLIAWANDFAGKSSLLEIACSDIMFSNLGKYKLILERLTAFKGFISS